MPILNIKKISKHFGGVFAVNNLTLTFESGKIIGIVGPNGSGKSTLTNLLTGIYKPDHGQITLNGLVLHQIIPYQNPLLGITRSFQEVRLFEQMPVIDNLLVVLTEKNVFASLFSRHKQLDELRAKQLLETVGLWDKRHQLALHLSYGQRKLLEIARVLAMDAQIIFLDEPFAGLFKEMTKIVINLIQQLRKAGKTIILIEHNMELIRELCDDLYILNEGKLLAQGTPNVVLSEKKVIEAYLGE